MLKPLWILGLALHLMLPACRQRAGESATTGAPTTQGPAKRSVLLVGFGGWNSCRLREDPARLPTAEGFADRGLEEIYDALTPEHTFTWEQLLNLASTMRDAGVDVTWMSTCFFLDTPVERSIWYRTSDGAEARVATLAVTREIERLAGNREIILVGHSYGGWMAATVASAISRPVLAVYTLEAISGEGCPTLAAVTGSTADHPDCRRAPASGRVDLAAAKRRVRTWTNIHLPDAGRDLDIYSGPYPAPIENLTLPYANIDKGPFSNAHHLLGLGKATWDLICQRTSRNLGVEAPCRALDVDRWGRRLAPP